MSTKTEEKIVELQKTLNTEEIDELKRMTTYRLSDAIRSGSKVSEQAHGWGNGDTMCALHAAVADAHARGYMG